MSSKRKKPIGDAKLASIINAFIRRPTIYLLALDRPSHQEVERLWEEAHYWLHSQIDDLLTGLSGTPVATTTKEKALRRLRPFFERAFNTSLTDTSTDEEGDIEMKTKSKAVKKGFGTVTKKTAPVKKGAVVVNGTGGKFAGFNLTAKITVKKKDHDYADGSVRAKMFDGILKSKTVADAQKVSKDPWHLKQAVAKGAIVVK